MAEEQVPLTISGYRLQASRRPSFPAFLLSTINSINFYPVKFFVEKERSGFNRGNKLNKPNQQYINILRTFYRTPPDNPELFRLAGRVGILF